MKTSETICGQARPYYYDFLTGRKNPDIPDALWCHITTCKDCIAEVSLLGAALDQSDEDPFSHFSHAASTTNLELQMALLGQPLDCRQIRPFLAPLADPLFQIKGPTPVKAHLDECHACADDLAAIRRLNLTQAQYCRLGRIAAGNDRHEPQTCSTAAAAIHDVAALDLQNVDPAAMRHISTCPECRQSLFRHRQTITHALPPVHKPNGVSCEQVAFSDLFDICLPFDRPPGESSPTLLAHVSSCRRCMDKLQELLHIVSQVMDRPNSGIITCLTLADLTRLQKSIAARPAASQPSLTVPTTLPRSTPAPQPSPHARPNLRPFLKPVAAAAAILLAAMLVFRGTSLQATDLGYVYEKLAAVETMQLNIISPERNSIIQQIWVSKSPPVKIFKDSSRYIVWDLDSKTRTETDTSTGRNRSVPLDNSTVRQVGSTLIGPMNILPFTKLADAPRDRTWRQLDEAPADALIHDTEIYEMVWNEKAVGGISIQRRWIGYLQPQTKLPLRTEFYSRTKGDADYQLQQISEISYPDRATIQDLIQSIGL